MKVTIYCVLHKASAPDMVSTLSEYSMGCYWLFCCHIPNPPLLFCCTLCEESLKIYNQCVQKDIHFNGESGSANQFRKISYRVCSHFWAVFRGPLY